MAGNDKKETASGDIYRGNLIALMDDWYEQVKEFRRLSLAAEDPVEVTRMRAKADTLRYRQQEILLLIEEMDLLAEDGSGNS